MSTSSMYLSSDNRKDAFSTTFRLALDCDKYLHVANGLVSVSSWHVLSLYLFACCVCERERMYVWHIVD